MTRKKTKFMHEGKYAAEVSVDLIVDDTAWSPHVSRCEQQTPRSAEVAP